MHLTNFRRLCPKSQLAFGNTPDGRTLIYIIMHRIWVRRNILSFTIMSFYCGASSWTFDNKTTFVLVVSYYKYTGRSLFSILCCRVTKTVGILYIIRLSFRCSITSFFDRPVETRQYNIDNPYRKQKISVSQFL